MVRVVVLAAVGVLAAASPAFARDDSVTSFDGTKIVLHFFPAADLKAGDKAPTVMFGPGWSSPGVTDAEAASDPTTGAVGVGPLRHAGFNVLTWDPRGFGGSEGTVMSDSPEFEGRDAQALIDYIAKQPEAKLDKAGDPRLGMSGASYGGGIQLVTAALDSRVDAITPDIAWHSLVTSLLQDDTFKAGWSSILYSTGKARGRLDPHIDNAYRDGVTTGKTSDENKAWFASRGPAELVRKIRIPTLLMQGTADTLFTLDEATTNYEILRGNGVPVRMLWFCGGHGACLTGGADDMRFEQSAIAWLKRYLNQDTSIDTGAGFEWIDQDGKHFTAPGYPLAPAGALTGTGGGMLPLTQPGGSGPTTGGSGQIAALSAPTNGTKATNALNVAIPGPATEAPVVGAPEVKITYSGSGSATDARIYGQIVDDVTNVVLGNLVTPIPVVLDGAEHTVTRPLEIVATTARPGASYTLQIVANTTAYDPQRVSGLVTLKQVDVSLPLSRIQTAAGSAGPAAPGASRTTLKLVSARTRGVRSLRVKVRVARGSLRSVVVAVRTRGGRVIARRKVKGSLTGTRTITVALRSRLPKGARVVITGTRSDGTRVSAGRAARR